MVELHNIWMGPYSKNTKITNQGQKDEKESQKKPTWWWNPLYCRADIQLFCIRYSAILVARLGGPLLLKTAGRWTWDMQFLSLNWQTGRNTLCNNQCGPIHTTLLFSLPDCLVVDSLKTSLLTLREQPGECNIWGFLPAEPIKKRLCIRNGENVKKSGIQNGIDPMGAHVNGWREKLISLCLSFALFSLSLSLSFPSPVPVTAGRGLLPLAQLARA